MKENIYSRRKNQRKIVNPRNKYFNRSYVHDMYNKVLSGEIAEAINVLMNDDKNALLYLTYRHVPKLLTSIYDAIVSIPEDPTEHDLVVFANEMNRIQETTIGGPRITYNGKDPACIY